MVITCASHAQGRRFEPGRKHSFSFLLTAQSSHISLMCWSIILVLTDTLGFHGVMVSTLDFESSDPSSNLGGTLTWLRGATVARLTPDQKAACSNHVGVKLLFSSSNKRRKLFNKMHASNEDWTHDLWFTRPTLCHWAIEALAVWLPLSVLQDISHL